MARLIRLELPCVDLCRLCSKLHWPDCPSFEKHFDLCLVLADVM